MAISEVGDTAGAQTNREGDFMLFTGPVWKLTAFTQRENGDRDPEDHRGTFKMAARFTSRLTQICGQITPQ